MNAPARRPSAGLIEDLQEQAAKQRTNLRLGLFGPPFAGKSVICCGMPNALIFDVDKGSDWYRRRSVIPLPVDDFDHLQALLQDYISKPRAYRTVCIDGMTTVWKMFCKKWEGRFLRARGEGRGGHHGDWFELQMLDWGPVKSDWDHFTHRLKRIDANLIFTMREKNEMERAKGKTHPEVIGQTFDLPPSFQYEVDVMVQLQSTKNRKAEDRGLYGSVHGKDRTFKLPKGVFQITRENLTKWFGEKIIGAPAKDEKDEDPTTTPPAAEPASPPADTAAGARDALVAELEQLSDADREWFRENLLKGDPLKMENAAALEFLEELRRGEWRNR
jgi:hypothetical protein